MAKANWVKVTPSQGSGDATVNVSSVSEHTGREIRTTILTWKATNIEDIQRTVRQAGKTEYVDIADTASADKAGKVVTITGVTNSSKLYFSLGGGDLDITLPTYYKANSLDTPVKAPGTNISVIDGDPGALAEFPFSISITVPANTSTTAKSRSIIVTDNAGNEDSCRLVSAAGDAYVTITSGDIELDYLGTPVAVAVKSNTNWTIE